MHDEGIALYEEFYGRYLVQGIRDKVDAYLLEQRALAEAAEAEAAELAAAELAAAELAVELAAAELSAAELAAAELAAAELAAAELAAAEAAAAFAQEETTAPKTISGSRHFLEGISIISILIAVAMLYTVRRLRKNGSS
jgi:hypothetical protein